MKILVLPGDGIGEEITRATMTVLNVVNNRFSLGLEFEFEDIGFKALDKTGTTLPDYVMEKAKQAEGIILGPISHLDYPPREHGGVNVSAAFRVKLDLYANIRPARSRAGLSRLGKQMDIVIMRECTEGFYSDRNMVAGTGEFMPTHDMALSVRKITAFACERIARRSFELARTRRFKVTAVHKANCMILTDGLFLREVRKVAEEFSDVELDEMIIDAMCAHLVRDPSRFDVVVATNLYGDILSDLASELSGSLGLAGSINAGDNLAAAQAQHGSAPDIAGQDRANPTSLILSSAMLLSWLAERYNNRKFSEAAAAIDRVIDNTLEDQSKRTADLGGPMGTQAFAEIVADELRQYSG
ncbi:MAG: isocitrate/isopropylmalate dehydrogenase family protein [Deltaproteobacteria bacterium]|nr:isocitrate/isopropylmalate dehydrogenase family protein [Deltaproteobacteria bacterium]MBW2151712.1 isocitrate/isopropylmalate dehydrogenase family protein [Deltaproteobacteria bacterium]